jgi:cytochrome c-550 PedF
MTYTRVSFFSAASLAAILAAGSAFGHGDVLPQTVDTTGLPDQGEEWVAENPYRDSEHFELAVEIGSSAYNQNCARCHGLEAISGGIAPDLRKLEPDDYGDEWYVERVRNGAVRDGVTYMPVFAEPDGPLSQEALWAIRSYLASKYDPKL